MTYSDGSYLVWQWTSALLFFRFLFIFRYLIFTSHPYFTSTSPSAALIFSFCFNFSLFRSAFFLYRFLSSTFTYPLLFSRRRTFFISLLPCFSSFRFHPSSSQRFPNSAIFLPLSVLSLSLPFSLLFYLQPFSTSLRSSMPFHPSFLVSTLTLCFFAFCICSSFLPYLAFPHWTQLFPAYCCSLLHRYIRDFDVFFS